MIIQENTAPPGHGFKRVPLFVLVLFGLVAGSILGAVAPDIGSQLKPLSDIFIRLLKMLVGPIVFLTIMVGIAQLGDIRRVGRVGGKSLLYFMVLTGLALCIGLIVVNILQPGMGMHIDPKALSTKGAESYISAAQDISLIGFATDIVPSTFLSAFTSGNLLQIVFVAILFGVATSAFGDSSAPLMNLAALLSKIFIKILNGVMLLAPVAVFGAIAFTVAEVGASTLASLGYFMICFYITCLTFIFGILGLVSLKFGGNIVKIILYIREELLTAFGTASSESVLIPLMEKLERLGAPREIVGLVIPSGYSFNMDGNAIYLTMAAVFLAQALDIPLSLYEQLGLLAVALLTSKGSSGVAGSGFIVLAATLAVTPQIPVEAIALILGIDRFMSEARVLTNIIGNTVATLFIAKWEGQLDTAKLESELSS